MKTAKHSRTKVICLNSMNVKAALDLSALRQTATKVDNPRYSSLER